MKSKVVLFVMFVLLHSLNFHIATAQAQGTAFTYQGRLNEGANPATGHYDLQFILFNVNQFGFPVGAILTNSNVTVNNGLFTASLDFGSGIFAGSNYWLEISVRTNGGGAFVTLNPRQPINPTPYAVFAESVGSGGLAGGAYSNAVTFNNVANNFSGSFSGNGAGLTGVNAATLGGLASSSFWKLGGNAGTTSNFIGTTDAQTFDIRVNNVRAMRYRLGTDASGSYLDAPNVIGGYSGNSALTTIIGATIGGGGGLQSVSMIENANKVTKNFGTVSGGSGNTASGIGATVSGGGDNIASGDSATVSGGADNTASGNYGTVPGGSLNVAGGSASFAAGFGANANHNGSFVWGDGSTPTSSASANSVTMRASGGYRFFTGDTSVGARLLSGDTAWSAISDRNAKKNFQPVDGEAVLEKLVAIPVEQWNYKWEEETNTPHIGPMAQDFKAAFYPGRDDKSISTLEFDGVELAAIQGLNQKLHEKDLELRDLKQTNDSLTKRLDELEATVRSLAQKRSQ